jgi:hypothetical protein
MDTTRFDAFKCSECGSVLTQQDWAMDGASVEAGAALSGPMCTLCGRWCCRNHLTVRRGAATCPSCADEYERIMTAGLVSDTDEALIVSLLLHDVSNTVGDGYQAVIARVAAKHRLSATDLADYHSSVVDEVQQHMHDTFADTTWPRCPAHPNHPMWFSAGWWRCYQLPEPVGRLGELTGNKE